MDVVFLSPAYPPEMQEYTRGLAEVGARVFGIGDSHPASLPQKVRESLHDYLHVPGILAEEDVIERASAWMRGRNIDRVEGIWEPVVLLAARLRDRWGIPGMSVDTVRGFRDKQLMKERVAAAGLRVPHAFRVRTVEEAWEAAENVGYPLIVKPIAGAGSADTYRVDDAQQMAQVLGWTSRVPEVSVEEFVDGEEFTFDTLCIDGEPVFENVAQYLPRPLVARTREDISPIIITVRDMYADRYAEGVTLGREVLKALNMGTGFTHMEWFKKADGEVVFGEIGCRPGGAHLVDQMNYTCDTDLFREWARCVTWKSFNGNTERAYNVAIVFKRAKGRGRITRIEGLDAFLTEHPLATCVVDLLQPGTHRRDWKSTLLSDGYAILRNPDWDMARRIADQFAADVVMYAE